MSPVPHIGKTLEQRAVMRLHLEREHAAEQERFNAIHAQLTVDELMSRFQPQPCDFCSPAEVDIPPPAPFWLVAMWVVAWLSIGAIGLGWNLAVVRAFFHFLRGL